MRYVADLLAIIGLAVPAVASAVCVEGHIPTETELERSWAVVVARVESGKEAVRGAFLTTEYRLRVVEALRGNPGGVIRVLSEHNSGAFPMKIGSSYLAFVQRNDDVAFIDYCGSSGTVKARKDLISALRQRRDRSR